MNKEIMLRYVNDSIKSMKNYSYLDVLNWEYAKIKGILEMLYCLEIISYDEINKLNNLAMNVMLETKRKLECEMK